MKMMKKVNKSESNGLFLTVQQPKQRYNEQRTQLGLGKQSNNRLKKIKSIN